MAFRTYIPSGQTIRNGIRVNNTATGAVAFFFPVDQLRSVLFDSDTPTTASIATTFPPGGQGAALEPVNIEVDAADVMPLWQYLNNNIAAELAGTWDEGAGAVAAVFGQCDSFTFDTTPSKLVNYTDESVAGTTDPVAGEVTVDIDGTYELNVFLVGTQGNSSKDEEMQLEVQVNAIRTTLSSYDVATNKTNVRTFSATVTRRFSAGDVISLWCEATGNMGTFTVDTVSLEIKKV